MSVPYLLCTMSITLCETIPIQFFLSTVTCASWHQMGPFCKNFIWLHVQAVYHLHCPKRNALSKLISSSRPIKKKPCIVHWPIKKKVHHPTWPLVWSKTIRCLRSAHWWFMIETSLNVVNYPVYFSPTISFFQFVWKKIKKKKNPKYAKFGDLDPIKVCIFLLCSDY